MTLGVTSVDWQAFLARLIGRDGGGWCKHSVFQGGCLAQGGTRESGHLAALGHWGSRLHLWHSCLAASIAARHGQWAG